MQGKEKQCNPFIRPSKLSQLGREGMVLADEFSLDLQIEAVCDRNPLHSLQLLGAIQCDDRLAKSL